MYLFAERARYVTFTRALGANTAGLFVPGPPSFLTSYLGGQGRDALRRALQHEAFHQFAYFRISRHLPIWLNEGLAQVYEEGIWTGKSFLVGQVPPWRMRQVQFDANHFKLVPLAQFLNVTPAAWSGILHADAAKGALNYNEAWALTQFLTRGPDADDRARSADLLRRLHATDASGPATGDDPAATQAFAASFPDTAHLQTAFNAWIERLRATDAAVLVERQTTLGDLLVALRAAGRSFDSVPDFRTVVVGDRLRVHYTRIGVRYWSNPNPAVYFEDLQGQVFPSDQLFFAPAPDAPLPDLVCQESPAFRMRTHFYPGDGGRPEHELLIEPSATPPGPTP